MKNLKVLTIDDDIYGREIKYAITMEEFLESGAKLTEVINYHGIKPETFYVGLKRYILKHGLRDKVSTHLVRTDHGSVVYLKRIRNVK